MQLSTNATTMIELRDEIVANLRLRAQMLTDSIKLQKTKATKPMTKPNSWAKRPMPVASLVPDAGVALREVRVSSE